jgi:hypothetical protein
MYAQTLREKDKQIEALQKLVLQKTKQSIESDKQIKKSFKNFNDLSGRSNYDEQGEKESLDHNVKKLTQQNISKVLSPFKSSLCHSKNSPQKSLLKTPKVYNKNYASQAFRSSASNSPRRNLHQHLQVTLFRSPQCKSLLTTPRKGDQLETKDVSSSLIINPVLQSQMHTVAKGPSQRASRVSDPVSLDMVLIRS